jgi:hypothetical protein
MQRHLVWIIGACLSTTVLAGEVDPLWQREKEPAEVKPEVKLPKAPTPLIKQSAINEPTSQPRVQMSVVKNHLPRIQTWQGLPGQSLEDVLKNWCQKAGWQAPVIRLRHERMPRLTSSVAFAGSFESAVNNLLMSLRDADIYINATAYTGNRVLAITEE